MAADLQGYHFAGHQLRVPVRYLSVEPFERYSPYGTPEHVAEFLSPYIEAGCSAFNVIPCAVDDESAIAAVGELRQLLIDVPSGCVLNSAAGAAPTIPSSR
jgi:hypothetical protein